MKTGSKRWVMIFSLALNVGFLVMAAYGYYAHNLANSLHLRHSQAIEQSLRDLDMPSEIKLRAKEEFAQFTGRMQQIRTRIKATGNENFEILGKQGSFDEQAFDQNWDKIAVLWQQKHALVKAHLKKMRQILGPEYSVAFFNNIKLKTRNDKKP